jgi:hypothetical protein
VLGIFALLGRVAGGKYLKPIVGFLMKLPLIGKADAEDVAGGARAAKPGARERRRKMERAASPRIHSVPRRRLSRLSRDERAAYLDATTEQADAVR